jgi:hypothetical protein
VGFLLTLREYQGVPLPCRLKACDSSAQGNALGPPTRNREHRRAGNRPPLPPQKLSTEHLA